MTDTHKSIQLRFERMMADRVPMERLRMGSSMFDTAKTIVRDSIVAQHPGISSQELKKEIFLRFYGQEFNKVQIKKISKALSL